jgi:hypothetical protein
LGSIFLKNATWHPFAWSLAFDILKFLSHVVKRIKISSDPGGEHNEPPDSDKDTY